MKNFRQSISIIILVLLNTYISAQELTADFSYFPKTELNDRIVESYPDINGNTLQKIILDGFDSRIPFYHIKPKNKTQTKFVLLLHGLTSSKEEWLNKTISLGKLKDSLLTLGYNVLIPDAKYHGERTYQGDFQPPLTFFSSQDIYRVNNLYTSTVRDIRIILDYLESKSNSNSPLVDVVGYSMGGQMTIFLNSVDKRLNRVVVCVAPLDAEKGSKMIGMNADNAKKMQVLSPKNYATLQNAPITLLMGTKDNWYTKNEAQDFFDKINLKDKSLKFYDSGHFLPDEFIHDVIEILNKK